MEHNHWDALKVCVVCGRSLEFNEHDCRDHHCPERVERGKLAAHRSDQGPRSPTYDERLREGSDMLSLDE